MCVLCGSRMDHLSMDRIVLLGLFISTLLGCSLALDITDYDFPVVETGEAPAEAAASPLQESNLPEQPTLRQVLESMKPPSLTDDEYAAPGSEWLSSKLPDDSSDLSDTSSDTESPAAPVSGSGDVPAPEDGAVVNVTTLTTTDNSTSLGNATSSKLCNCLPLNRTEADHRVRMVNATVLYDELAMDDHIRSRSQLAQCALVLFYGVSCPFSAAAAPHFNALPRAYPDLNCLAVEATAVENDMSLNSRFGIIAVPTLLLFHNGRAIARFNESEPTLHRLSDFVQAQTLVKPSAVLNVTSADFGGPVLSVAKDTFNWYLALAWAFIIACALYGSAELRLWRRVADNVRNWWIEAEQHLHED